MAAWPNQQLLTSIAAAVVVVVVVVEANVLTVANSHCSTRPLNVSIACVVLIDVDDLHDDDGVSRASRDVSISTWALVCSTTRLDFSSVLSD